MVDIYALMHPVTGKVFYIGKANDASNRIQHHMKPTRLAKAIPKNDFIKKEILAYGLEPKLIVLEKANDLNWREREKFWVKTYKDAGHPIHNDSEGGEGPHGFRLK